MDTYAVVAGKFLIGMLVMILQINLLGKYEFSINTPLNQIQNYVLGGIIGGVIYNPSITVLHFCIVLLVWSLVVIIVKVLIEASGFFRSVVAGRPRVLVRDGQVDVAQCARVGLTADQLSRHLREEGVHSIRDVTATVMAQNGRLTTVCAGDDAVELLVISNGRINREALELIGRDEAWVAKKVGEQGYKGVRDIFLGEFLKDELELVPYPKSR